LVILSPYAGIRDLTSLTTNPTNAGPDSFCALTSNACGGICQQFYSFAGSYPVVIYLNSTNLRHL